MMSLSLDPGQSVNGKAKRQRMALLFILAVYLFFTCNQTIVKYVSAQGVDPFLISWGLLTTHALIAALALRLAGRPWLSGVQSFVGQGIRGLLLFLSGFTGFSSLLTLQIADLVAIAFMCPFVILILARVFLKEQVGIARWLVIAVGFAGVYIIARPGTSAMQVGHIWAFSSVLVFSIYSIQTKVQSGHETSESMLVLPPLIAVIVLSPLLLLVEHWPQTLTIWSLLLVLGCFSALAHGCLVLAYQRASASLLAPYGYSQMIWAVIFGYLVFGQLPDFWTVIGTGVIVASGLWLVAMDRRKETASLTP